VKRNAVSRIGAEELACVRPHGGLDRAPRGGGLVCGLFLDQHRGPPTPPAGYVALTLGALFSLVVGIGLMALMFYSSRHGYDQPPHDHPPDNS
jgi:hypothetical protein